MTGFTPPRRDMPPDVRDRLRRRLWRDLDAPGKTRFDRARTSVAAAIGVVVIAACAVIFAQTVPAATKTTPASAPEPVAGQMVDAQQADPGQTDSGQPDSGQTDPGQTDSELDRCYQAASSTGHHLPDRPQWIAAFTTETAGISVTAARADGKPLFCESTLTSVTVSDPDAQPAYATGSATGALFATSNGTIAGVVDPAWQRFEVRVTNGSSFAISELEASDGLFVMHASIPAGPNLKLHAQELPANSSERPADNDPQYPIREMPPLVAPSAYTMDRPVVPAPDRSSPRGQALQQCMSRSSGTLPDIDSWQPAASAVINGTELIMATNARGIASCQWQPYKTTMNAVPANDQVFRAYMPITREPRSFDTRQFIVQTDGNVGLVIGGTVRSDATRMTVLLDGKVELDTDVRGGTFLSVVPDSLTDEFGGLAKQQLDEMTAVIYDAKGNTLYSGLLNPR